MRRFGAACAAAVGSVVVVGAGCGDARTSNDPSPAGGVYSVTLTVTTLGGLPKCTSAIAGTVAVVSSPLGLWTCQGQQWEPIPCSSDQAGRVAYAGETGTLWACISKQWTPVALPDAGVAGPPGPQGEAGPPGPAGASVQVSTTELPVGSSDCPTGGMQIVVTDGSVTSTSFLCNGPAGVQGPPGAPGQSVTSTALDAGDTHCPNGGTAFTSVSGTTYACNGGGVSVEADSGTTPPSTIAVDFRVDDTANKVYTAGSLLWKGSMAYDASTRKITRDSSWTGPFAPLYDDGAWDVGGHEPKGAVAGDHIWGITVFATPPSSGADTYEYGLLDATYEATFGSGSGWVWPGQNGSFTIPAGAAAEVTAVGTTFPPFGTTDLEVTVDLQNLASGTAWDTSNIALKGDRWGWSAVPLPNCTPQSTTCMFTLSAFVGSGKPLAHSGLLQSGTAAEFVLLFNGVEYRHATGVSAATRAQGGSWTPAAVAVDTVNTNLYVSVP